jgi:hypothetical protein
MYSRGTETGGGHDEGRGAAGNVLRGKRVNKRRIGEGIGTEGRALIVRHAGFHKLADHQRDVFRVRYRHAKSILSSEYPNYKFLCITKSFLQFLNLINLSHCLHQTVLNNSPCLPRSETFPR